MMLIQINMKNIQEIRYNPKINRKFSYKRPNFKKNNNFPICFLVYQT